MQKGNERRIVERAYIESSVNYRVVLTQSHVDDKSIPVEPYTDKMGESLMSDAF